MANLTWKEWRGILLALVIAAVVIYAGASAIANQRNARDKAICVQIEALKKSARITLKRSLKTIPTLEYYQLHPVELKKAIDSTNDALKTFKEHDCDSIP